jgi:hypothetical protein
MTNAQHCLSLRDCQARIRVTRTYNTEEDLSMSRLGSLLAVIVLALALQGCIVEYKEVIDIYPFASGLLADRTHQLFDITWRGESYCFPEDTRFSFEARFGQPFPEGAFMLLFLHLLTDGGAREQVLRHRAAIGPTGRVRERISDFPAICLFAGDRLRASIRVSEDIEPNRSLWSKAIFGTTNVW